MNRFINFIVFSTTLFSAVYSREIMRFPVLENSGRPELNISPDGGGLMIIYHNTAFTNRALQVNGTNLSGIAGSTIQPDWSPDGKYFYFISKENDGLYSLFINGGRMHGFEDIRRFLPGENGSYLFLYRRNKLWYTRLNGKDFGPYKEVIDCKLSDNGRHSGWIYRKDKDGEVFVRIDGAVFGGYEGPKDDAVRCLTINNGGWGFFYRKVGWNALFNGVIKQTGLENYPDMLNLSPDAKHYTFVCHKKDDSGYIKCFIGHDGKYYPSPVDGSFPEPWNLMQSDDGLSFAALYRLRGPEEQDVILQNDGILLTNRNSFGCVRFLPGTCSLAYSIDKKGGYATVINGEEYPEAAMLFTVNSSPGCKMWGYAFYRDERFYMRITNSVFGPFDGIETAGEAFNPPRFSPDGKIFGFIFDRHSTGNPYSSYLCVNGKYSGPYPECALCITPSNRAVAAYISNGYAVLEDFTE